MSNGDAAPLCEDRTDLLGNAPWWLISAGVHVALLLMATLVYIEKYVDISQDEIIVRVLPPSPPPIVIPPPPPETHEGPTTPFTDGREADPDDPPFIPFIPNAEIGDHVETDDPGRPDTDSAWGDSLKALAHFADGGPEGFAGTRPGPGIGRDSLGVGSSIGDRGKWGRPDGGGRRDMVPIIRNGGDKRTVDAAENALAWLARHQSADGNWKAAGFADGCVGKGCEGAGVSDYDTGVTGLALLAFLGAGYTHLSSSDLVTADLRAPGKSIRYRDVVKKAVRWLVANQDMDGCIGPKTQKMMYNHAIATLALAEAYGMTESQLLKEPAQHAVDWLIAAKNPYKAWRYSARCGENDASVTGWCVMALKSAAASNLTISEAAMREANDWIKADTESNYGKVGYTTVEEAGVQVKVPGKNDDYANHEALGAVGMMTRIFVETDRKDPVLEQTAKWLVGDLPVWDKGKKTNDYYYWYYGTLALFQYDGPDSGGKGDYWRPWNSAMQKALTANQRAKADGCAAGSWDADDRWGFDGGRVYATAINALTMEVYCRYPNAFGTKAEGKKRE